jgi:hypothetical protein
MDMIFNPPTIPAKGRPPTAKQELALKAAQIYKQQRSLKEICDSLGASIFLARWYIYQQPCQTPQQADASI